MHTVTRLVASIAVSLAASRALQWLATFLGSPSWTVLAGTAVAGLAIGYWFNQPRPGRHPEAARYTPPLTTREPTTLVEHSRMVGPDPE